MPFDALHCELAPPPAPCLAPCGPRDLRVLLDAHPRPGMREFSLVAPCGRSVTRIEVLDRLSSPALLAQVAAVRAALEPGATCPFRAGEEGAPVIRLVRSEPASPRPERPDLPPPSARP